MLHPQRKTMDLVPLVCLCLLTWSAGTAADHKPVVVNVELGSDVVLPCSLSTQQSLTDGFFEWKKDQKQVFFYDGGSHSNNGHPGQDEQFKGRVSYFEDQLKNGNASIKIRNMKIADSGDYTCDFPRLQPPQTFYIKLVVDPDPQRKILKDRSDKNIGAAKPYVKLVKTDDGVLLQCEVKGASSQPKVEWKDSAGNILPAEEPQVTERGGSYDVILQATVTKTDIFTCVYTEEDNNHQISDWTYAALNGAAVKPSVSLVKTDDGMVLQCVVRGASPQPKVEWKDSAGNILPAKELPADKGSYDVILQAPLTKTDTFTCVVTQEELNHQSSAETYAALNEKTSNNWTGVVIGIIATLIVGIVGAVVGIVGIVLAVRARSERSNTAANRSHGGLSPDNDNSEPNQQRGENNGLLSSPETKSASKDQDNTPV